MLRQYFYYMGRDDPFVCDSSKSKPLNKTTQRGVDWYNVNVRTKISEGMESGFWDGSGSEEKLS